VISYLAALLAAVTNAASNALNRKAAREAPGRDQFRLRLIFDLLHRRAWLAAISLMFLSFVLLVLPAAALIAGAVALIRSPRLQALQADGTGPGDAPPGPPGRRERPVKAAGHR
jgi:hypothetical protein